MFSKRLNPYLISSNSSGTKSLLSIHWHPLYCLLQLPYQTGHPWALFQLILSYRVSRSHCLGWFGEQFQVLPLFFFWLGCALGKRNLGSSFPPHLQWFAQTDISNCFNLSNFGQIFQAPVLNWLLNFPCEVAGFFSKWWSTECLKSSRMKMCSGTTYHGLIFS